MIQATNEKVLFRLIQMPCCHTLLCWVNPRRPNYCPECGKHVFLKLKSGEGVLRETEGWLHLPAERNI
jgi:hypothetical protein